MRILLAVLVAAGTLAAAAPEPAAHPLTAVPLTILKPPAHFTAARELADGRVLISDVTAPSIVVLDPASGVSQPVGSAGAGADQYAQPGGFYAGEGSSTIVADHSGPRALVIGPDARIVRSFPTARKGTRSSSDGDGDQTRLDARGLAYFMDRGAGFKELLSGGRGGWADLVRLDPVAQTVQVVTRLTIPKEEVIPGGDGMTFSRATIGDPADGWGVLPDGRVAVVRASPYRIDSISPTGVVTPGPVVDYDPIPFTAADRESMEKTMGPGASVGASTGGGGNAANLARKYAVVKPPFFPDDVIVSSAGRVWVMRTQPFGAATVVYDVFDPSGKRVDRISFPANSRVIGFGASSVFVREGGGSEQLKKYRTP